ncbi:hypothetical protein HMJ29_19655 [Hymenobacter taeanensis]|uniref:Uncharacterized protein n=1 Tax=Hymenobacter taeanensis TaxID=2735321 RepID=A0A6M6BNB8_9BACT|nr:MULTISPECIES: hypothetical protein [Hymenobacter]QJX49003.1 hypothetical protein HMJ29_19655 [Hymenobacter taeanensis]UOQ81481.1 hypothetical protein MUN83_01375 [Hymenobacter sp. 5414T-23]
MDLETEFRELSAAETVFYLRLGLQLEVISLPDVSDWVDAVLLRDEAPETLLVELYVLLRTNRQQVLGYLSQLFPATERYTVRPALAWLQQQLANNTGALGQVLRALYRLRLLVSSEVEVGWIYGLAADYERSAPGPSESLQEVYLDTAAFLACYQDYTFANRSQWLYLDAVLEQRLASLRP